MRLNTIYLKRLGELLVFHRIIKDPYDLTEVNISEKIVEFQEKVDIMLDGIPRWETLWQLQFPWAQQEPKMPFVKCDVDFVHGTQGKDHIWLRHDGAERFNALRKEVVNYGGVVTANAGKRSLTEGTSSERSITSMHYVGLAFDLAMDTGFFNPKTDPYVITIGGNNYWEVWCRAPKGEERKLNVVYWDDWNSGIDQTTTVQGKFINLTKICARHGFYPIRPRLSFARKQNRKYTGCEWWHFQADDLLIPNLSQFGIELLRIEGYTPEHLRSANENLWARKQTIFQLDWF